MTQKTNIQRLIQDFSIETTPGAAKKISHFSEFLRPGTIVYITFLPGSDFQDTINVAKRLSDENLVPVPHFAARSIQNEKVLKNFVEKIVQEAGVRRVLCIAGAVSKPVGDFTDSMQLLETEIFDKNGITHISLAGHPEGSPDIPDEEIDAAIIKKNNFQKNTDAKLNLITQFAFEAKPIIQWAKKLEYSGNTLPITVGIPGIATLKTLLMHAAACGIGPSIQFLKKQAKANISNLLRTQNPNQLIFDIAKELDKEPNCGINKIHIYPLGGLKKSADWGYSIQDGLFKIDSTNQTISLID